MSITSDFPRGTLPPGQATPTATARWAFPYEVAAHRYQDGDIWLGVLPVPHADALPVIQRLGELKQALAAVQNLDPAWLDNVARQIDVHVGALDETDEIAIGIDDDRHMVTDGGTRGGKGTSRIIPNLCLYPGSVICIDPKGENAKITASRRGMGSKHCDGLGQTVAVLDPYDTTKLPDGYKASWNPLDTLDPADPQLVDRATSIVEALIVRTNPEHAHFDDSARSLIKGILLYVCVAYAGRPDRNLITVYDLLTRGAWAQLQADQDAHGASESDPDGFTYLLYLMKRREEFGRIISAAASMVLDMGDRERGSVLSTARLSLEFIERPAMREVLRTSSFDMDRIKTDKKGMTLYLCLPPQRMSDCGRWLRLVINACLNRMYEIDEEPATGKPVLFLLEEFASLKHMEIIEHAAGYAAGFGVKLWVIVQDIPQLKRYYKEGWETFLGNAGVVEGFANSDETSLGFFSKKLGEAEVVQRVQNVSTNFTANTNEPAAFQHVQGLLQSRSPIALMSGPLSFMTDQASHGQSASTSTSANEQVQKAPLLLPDEIERLFRREAMTALVTIKGERPIALRRKNFFEDPTFAGLYDPIREPFFTKAEALAVANSKRKAFAEHRRRVIENAALFADELMKILAKASRSKA